MTSKKIIRRLGVATPLVVVVTAILLYSLVPTAFASSKCLSKDTTIIVDIYSGMTRTIHFKANQTSNTVQGISVVLKC
jgi:hypothetical protein